MGNLRLRHTILAITLPVVTLVGLLLGIPAPAGGFEHPPLKGFLEEKFELSDPPVPAPQAGFTDGSGRRVSLGAFKGKVVLLNFWATWCPPCVWEMPKLNSLQARLRGEGLAVVTVSVDRKGYPVVKPFLKRHGLVHLKAYLDPKYNLKRQFGYGGLPTTVLIDAQGRVVGMMVGAAEWDSPDAIELVRYYLRRRYAVPESLDPLETADQAEDDSAYDAYQRGDYAAAYWEWLPLAEEGDAEAQFNLGILYDLGQGVAQSKVRAATWYRRSAEQGFAAAQYNLAVMFANGEGIPRNNVLAYALFDLAAADDPEAAEQRDNMARSIAAEEIDRAVRLANRAREDATAMFLGEVLGAALRAELGPESDSAGPSPELVRTVQEALTVLGYDAGAADGMIGPRTRAAIRAFQADAELAAEGRVSQRLLTRLEQSMAHTSPPRASDENPAKQQYSSKIDRLLSEKRVAFVSSRGVSPNEFWDRLKAAGVELRNFSPTQLQSVKLFKPHIIIVDYDTSRAWRRQPKEVIRGILSNERLIGFGNGGAYLFRILGSGIGLGDAMSSPGNFQVEISTVPDEVLEAPEIPTIVTVHSPDTSTDAIGVYARGSPAISGFSGIARWVRPGQHWPIARQGNLLLWGFDAPLGTLTKEGKQLLLHLLVDHMHRSFRHYSKLIAKQTFVQPGILEDSLVPQLPSDIWYFRASRTGKIRAKLVWDPGTIALSLILNGLDGQERVAFARRGGQSPISLEYQVTSSDLARADKWRLTVVRHRKFSVSEISYKLILEFPN